MGTQCCSDRQLENEITDSIPNTIEEPVILLAKEQDSLAGKVVFKRFIKHLGNQSHNYELGKILGKGKYGIVYQCVNIQTKQTFAMKVVVKNKLRQTLLKQLIQQEMYVLTQLSHPNIIRIYELMEDQKNFYIVSEIINGGELFHHIERKQNKFDNYYVARIMRQLLLALIHLHERGLAHRDLKPENILMKDENNIKLSDFGCVKFLSDKDDNQDMGSRLYMAPEQMQGQDYGAAVDIWAFGIITCILLTGRHPFGADDEPNQLKRKVMNEEPEFTKEEMPKSAFDLITACLQKDPDYRPTSSQLLKSDFFEKFLSSQQSSIKTQKSVYNELLAFTYQSSFQTAIVSFIVDKIVTNQEIEQLQQVFHNMDVNGDGFLSTQELQEWLSQAIGDFKGKSENIKQIIEAMDCNKDGQVDYQEFISAAIKKDIVIQKQHLVSAFNMLDLNGDGEISRAELKQVFMGAVKNKNVKQVSKALNQMMADVDKDGDGSITFDEFREHMIKLISKQHIKCE